ASISNPNLDTALDTPVAEQKGKGKGKAFAHPATPARLKKRPLPAEDEGESRGVPPLDEDEKLADGVAALSVSASSTPGPTPQKQRHKRKSSPAPPSTPSAPLPDSPSESPSTTPLPKRIRLIVKPPPPPPIATHPAQLPRPRSFGGSLERLLSSFALLEEGDEDDLPEPPSRGPGQMIRPGEEREREKQKPVKIGMSWEEFAQSVRDEVEVWRRIEEMRRQGGLGCMRGWEIVRGDEDGEEEEEVEGEEETGGEGEAVNEGQDGEAERIEGLDSGRTPEAVEPTATPLVDLVSSPRAMEIDATDLDPTIPAELAPPKVPGTSSPPELRNLVEHGGLTGIEHSAIDGASSSLGLSGIEASLPGAQQTSVESVTPRPAPLGEGELTPGLEPTATVDIRLVDSALVESTSPSLLPGEDMVAEPIVEEPAPADAARPDTSPSTPTKIPTVPLPLPTHPSLPPSLHSILLDSIPSHARFVKETPLAHRHRVATLVARYWDRRQGAAERLIAAEERRVRAGAKALARGVVAKAWKDAVAVIRARLKEQEEAEQAREGRKHLAAILEQSSALLETQQEDMGRSRRPGGRSRSASSGASS
ncbi:swr1 complex component, partial [Ceratobasidium sp. 394]